MAAETYEGRPCPKGHTRRRRSSRSCIECRNEQSRIWMAERRASDPDFAERQRETVRKARENSITYFTTLLKNRRRAALRRQEIRNG
jgi:hypothetical protein